MPCQREPSRLDASVCSCGKVFIMRQSATAHRKELVSLHVCVYVCVYHFVLTDKISQLTAENLHFFLSRSIYTFDDLS